MMARFKRALARIDLEFLAEAVVAVSLFGGLWAGLVIGSAWGIK